MTEQTTASIVGSFVADAMALGTFGENDTSKIMRTYGRIDHLKGPELQAFHEGKRAGDFTHYGDQTYELLKSVLFQGQYDPQDYMTRWRALFKADTPIYTDSASAEVLERSLHCSPEYAKCGSGSTELGGAARVAPLLAVYADDREGLLNAAQKETEMTHSSLKVIEAARFFADMTYEVLQGDKPSMAINTLAQRYTKANSPIANLIHAGCDCPIADPVEAIETMGQSGDINQALPATIYLIRHFEASYQEAIIQNTMAGGDSGARGMLIGMVLGAYHGMNGIPAGWLEGLNRHEDLMRMIEGRAHHAYYEYEQLEAY